MQTTNTLLHLSLIENIGPATIAQIRQLKPAELQWHDLYSFSIRDLCNQFQLGPITAQNLYFGLNNKDALEHELALIDRNNITITTILDSDYPELLSNIHAPPPILYVQGASLDAYANSLAIIGSRAADRYGKQVIDAFVPSLVQHGWSIVSGGALGADAYAHAAALYAGGKTIVVLGSGLLHAGPSSNKKLFEQILHNNGTLMSIFPLDAQGRPEHFPIRNRVISGLSRGVIVIQAARKSGTRITAQYALEQGRDVFAVPGPIDDPLSEGCHALIQEGAKLISRVEDILDEYGQTSAVITNNAPQMEHVEIQQNLLRTNISQLTGEKKLILELCRNPISLEDLMRETNISLHELQTLLFDMQLEDFVDQNFAGLWQRR